MHLVFGPDQEDKFSAARESLLSRFERWLNDEGIARDRDAIDLACDAAGADWVDLTDFGPLWPPPRSGGLPAAPAPPASSSGVSGG